MVMTLVSNVMVTDWENPFCMAPKSATIKIPARMLSTAIKQLHEGLDIGAVGAEHGLVHPGFGE